METYFLLFQRKTPCNEVNNAILYICYYFPFFSIRYLNAVKYTRRLSTEYPPELRRVPGLIESTVTKMGSTTFVNEVVYILRDLIIDSARHWRNRAKETTCKYVTGVHWQKRCYFHSGMDKQPWYSPLKDGQHNFCQWSSSHTQRYNNWQWQPLTQWSKGNFSVYLQIHVCNWSPLTKALLFPLRDGQTALVQPTQRWAAQLLSMK